MSRTTPFVDGDLKHIDPVDSTITVHTGVVLKEGDTVNVQDIDGTIMRGHVEEVCYIVKVDQWTMRDSFRK